MGRGGESGLFGVGLGVGWFPNGMISGLGLFGVGIGPGDLEGELVQGVHPFRPSGEVFPPPMKSSLNHPQNYILNRAAAEPRRILWRLLLLLLQIILVIIVMKKCLRRYMCFLQ